jgi:ribosomal protein L12E/L44/L45/RPP1/RPP2
MEDQVEELVFHKVDLQQLVVQVILHQQIHLKEILEERIKDMLAQAEVVVPQQRVEVVVQHLEEMVVRVHQTILQEVEQRTLVVEVVE